MTETKEKDLVNKVLGGRTIPYNARLAEFFGGDVNTAIFLQQCLYWAVRPGKNKDGWFWKTIPTMQEEIGLRRCQQKRCVEILESNSFIETKIGGIPARRFIRVNIEFIEAVLKKYASNAISSEQASGIAPSRQVGSPNQVNDTGNEEELMTRESSLLSSSSPQKQFLIGLGNTTPFSSDVCIEKLCNSEFRSLQLMGSFFKFRKDEFESAELFLREAKSNLKAAETLAGLGYENNFYDKLFDFSHTFYTGGGNALFFNVPSLRAVVNQIQHFKLSWDFEYGDFQKNRNNEVE